MRIKLNFLPTVAVLVAAGTTISAQPVTSVFGLYGGGLQAVEDGGGIDETVYLLGFEAAFSYDFGPAFRGQLDINLENSGDLDDGEGSRFFVQTGVHANYVGANYTVGGFGLYQQGNQIDEDGGAARLMIGGEAAYYGGSFALFGQVGFSEHLFGDDDHGEPVGAIVGRVGARYYISPASAVSLEVLAMYSEDVVTGDQGPTEQVAATITYEQQFGNSTDWSWLGSVNMMRYSDQSHGDDFITETLFYVGVRFSPNSGSLQERDRSYAWYGMPLDYRGYAYVDVVH